MKPQTTLVLTACAAITVFLAIDFARVQHGWSRKSTYEVIGDGPAFIRETRYGYAIRATRDLPTIYPRRENGLAAREDLERPATNAIASGAK